MEIFRDQIRNAIIQTVDARGAAEESQMRLLETVQPMLHIPLIRSYKIDSVSLNLNVTAGTFVEGYVVPLNENWMIQIIEKGTTTTASQIAIRSGPSGAVIRVSDSKTGRDIIRDHFRIGEDVRIGLLGNADVNDTTIPLEILAQIEPF